MRIIYLLVIIFKFFYKYCMFLVILNTLIEDGYLTNKIVIFK